jgi:ribose-phosphate pyrophosphokinase
MFIAATHGLLLQGARARLEIPAVAKVFVTDSVRPGATGWTDLQVVSVAQLLSDAIRHVVSAAVRVN